MIWRHEPKGRIVQKDKEAMASAIERGDADSVEKLIRKKPDLVSALCHNGRVTPLEQAARDNQPECLDRLLLASVGITRGSFLGEKPEPLIHSALYLAAYRANLQCLRTLLPHATFDHQTQRGRRSALIGACMGKPLPAHWSADPDKTWGSDQDRILCVKALAALMDWTQTDSMGRLALHFAATQTAELLHLVLDTAGPLRKDVNGMTALMHAACDHNAPCIELLVPVSNLLTKDGSQRTAFDCVLANWSGSEACEQSLFALAKALPQDSAQCVIDSMQNENPQAAALLERHLLAQQVMEREMQAKTKEEACDTGGPNTPKGAQGEGRGPAHRARRV